MLLCVKTSPTSMSAQLLSTTEKNSRKYSLCSHLCTDLRLDLSKIDKDLEAQYGECVNVCPDSSQWQSTVGVAFCFSTNEYSM